MTEEQQQADINAIQRLHFELFRRVRYNLLDGERVVGDLLEWHDLWYSVLPTRFPYAFNKQDDRQYHPYTELSMLRHARWESWPADTLYIWTNDEALPQLRQRIEESRPFQSDLNPSALLLFIPMQGHQRSSKTVYRFLAARKREETRSR